MNNKKIIMVVGIYLILLVGLRFAWIGYHSSSDSPKASDGVLDLRDMEFTDDVAFPIDGEWVFFKGQLVDPKSTEEQLNGMDRTGITVPGDWRKTQADKNGSTTRHGTYQLRILLNEHQKQLFTLQIQEIKSSSTVFINGEKVAGMGHVGGNSSTSAHDYRPYEVIVEVGLEEINLMIHVSNYEANNIGGITKSLQFGTSQAVKQVQMLSLFKRSIVAGMLLIHGVYMLIIFCFFARKKVMIYLAFTFLFGGLATLLSVDKVLLYLFPAISWEWWYKFTYLSYASSAFFMLQYCKTIIAELSTKKIILFRYFAALNIIYCVYIICVLMEYRVMAGYLFTIIMIFIPLIVPFVLLKVVLRRGSDVIYLLIAITSVLSSLIWGWIKSNGLLTFPYYPFEFMIGVICFAIFWFKNHFQSAEESKKLAVKLQKINKRKDEFLANTSHELRNPLHGIINISRTIYESEKNLSDDNKENLQILMTVGRRMSMILNDLLDIEKLKEDGINLKTEEVNLSAVVSGVFDMLYFMKEGKNITFVNTIPDTFPSVVADENRLFQILFNLVHNAIKYSGGENIIVSVERVKGWAMIHVEDNGIGMDEETMKSIFEPYERVDSSMTAIAGGLGLGLSICKQLTKLQGGTLSVKSSVGKGSKFTFTLPVGSLQAPVTLIDQPISLNVAEISSKKTKPSSNKGFPRLLVVDDDPLNLAIMEQILLAEQYEVFTCTSGKEALVLLDKGTWDLIISDVMMPNMSGYELTRKIRERYTISELPILLLTARTQPEDIQTGFHCGANDYVTKPVEKLELTTRVRSLTNLRNSINKRVRMEAAWLQAQIQPHFLFNTLNTIAALSEIDPPKMMQLLDRFGKYLHASFAIQNLNQVVPLENEIDLVRSYVYIEQERFGDRLNVVWEIDNVKVIQIPPLSIQTIVENAINHGVLKRPEGGTVRIQIKGQREYIEITVADDGVGIAEGELENLLINNSDGNRGIGLLNTDKRLKQLYGAGLDITSSSNLGTAVRFNIPKEE
ncbi:hybrid sensor histidine kinase/response regulator [Sporosarcina psychrophila]|uniref:histidine kinase n=1 Tax=Sporosarcina psychrophila TaxID=1476 RepID=A0ABV2K608_SPOPS